MAVGVGRRLPALLNSYSAPALQRIVEGRELKLTSTRKTAAQDALRAIADIPTSVARMLSLLSVEQRALLDILLLYPGEVATHHVRRAAVTAGLVAGNEEMDYAYYLGYAQPTNGDPTKIHSKVMADLVAGLSYRLLALSSTASYVGALDLGLAGQVAVPAEIRPVILDLTAADPAVLAAPPGPPVAGDSRLVARAFFLLWSALRDKPAVLTQAGLVRKTDARRLGQVLGVADKSLEFEAEPDLAYLYFVRRLGGRLGLFALRDGHLDAAPRDRLREFLGEPWPQRTLRLLRAWAGGDGLHIALYTSPAPAGDVESRTFNEEGLRNGYRRLVELLAALPDAWVNLEAFIAWVRRRHFGWLVLPDPDPFAIHDLGTQMYRLSYGLHPEGDPWAVYEGAAIREGLHGALHWLGVVDLAGPPGTAQAFRLTAPGRALLGALLDPAQEEALLAPLGSAPATGRVVVQPNFQILALGDVPEDTLFALSEVAELVRAEQAVEFRLTQPSVYAAQQAGWTPAAILDLLRTASGAPLAQNVARSILDWGAAHERVVIRRNATLLAAQDAAQLDQILADPDAATLLSERLLPTVALVRPGATGVAASRLALDNRLLALGELPATSDLARDPPGPAFAFDAAGRVTWRNPLPDLRPLGLLAGLTRPGADGAPQLDERTVRATAAARRWKPPDVLALLDALSAWHDGPLPDSVVRQIKIWGGFQGRASLGPVTLLRVERTELLDDLLADPALAPWLTPLPGAGTFALVAPPAPARGRGRRAANAPDTAIPDDLAAVRAALLARGFTLDDAPGDAGSP